MCYLTAVIPKNTVYRNMYILYARYHCKLYGDFDSLYYRSLNFKCLVYD